MYYFSLNPSTCILHYVGIIIIFSMHPLTFTYRRTCRTYHCERILKALARGLATCLYCLRSGKPFKIRVFWWWWSLKSRITCTHWSCCTSPLSSFFLVVTRRDLVALGVGSFNIYPLIIPLRGSSKGPGWGLQPQAGYCLPFGKPPLFYLVVLVIVYVFNSLFIIEELACNDR